MPSTTQHTGTTLLRKTEVKYTPAFVFRQKEVDDDMFLNGVCHGLVSNMNIECNDFLSSCVI